MAAMVLIRLAKLTGSSQYSEAAEQTMLATEELMRRAPSATSQMLIAVDLQLGPTYELVLAGNLSEAATRSVLDQLHTRFLPNTVLACAGLESREIPTSLADLLRGKSMQGNTPTLYLCEGFTCQAPAQGIEEIAHTLDELIPQGQFD